MHIHYFTIKRLTAWLNQNFAAAMCMECFSQEKDELVLGLASNEKQVFLRVNCGNPFPYIWPTENFNRAKKNTAEIFPEIKGKVVSRFGHLPWERVMFLFFEDGTKLILKMHGGRSNVLFDSKNGRVLFRTNIPEDTTLELISGKYLPEEMNHYVGDVGPTLKKISPVLDKHFENFIEGKTEAGIKFKTAFEESIGEAEKGKFWLRLGDKGPYFSLHSQNGNGVLLSGEINSALDVFIRSKLKFSQYLQQYSRIEKKVSAEWRASEKQLKSYNNNLTALKKERNPEEIGNILMANLHLIPAHEKSMELFDFYTETNLKITLNPEWSAQENAAHYFRKNKKRKTQLLHLEELHFDAEKKERNWRIRMEAFTELVKPTEITYPNGIMDGKGFQKLNEFLSLFPEFLSEKMESVEKGAEFWEFFSQGYRILVGKNSKNNDKLSFQLAKKNDIWLHAKDVAGSHVVIQNPSGKSVPAPVLEYAAKLAAKNSKRKSESLVPVSWTYKKYVRKPKGLAPGAVFVDRETVLLIRMD